MRVLLIRHGDPDYAHDTLTAKGFGEADALGEHYRETPIDVIYVSPMGRAQATAKPLAGIKELKPVTLKWLAELNGNYTGTRWAWNVSGAENLADGVVPRHDTWGQTSPYGPHMLPLQRELSRQFDKLMARHGYRREGLRYRCKERSDETIVCVCHAGTILTLLGYLFNWALPLVYSHLAYDPTGVTDLRWEVDDGYAVPRAKTINDLSHLQRL